MPLTIMSIYLKSFKNRARLIQARLHWVAYSPVIISILIAIIAIQVTLLSPTKAADDTSLSVQQPFITTPEFQPTSCTVTLPSDTARTVVTLPIAKSGQYRIWSRVNIQNNPGSYFLQIDDQCPYLITPESPSDFGQWTWVDYQNGKSHLKIDVMLDAGNHIVRFIGWQGNSNIDRLIASSDAQCQPINTGQNCLP